MNILFIFASCEPLRSWLRTHMSLFFPNHLQIVKLEETFLSCYPGGKSGYGTWKFPIVHLSIIPYALLTYRLITAYLLLRVNLDKIMHARWDFDASSAWTRRVSALDKHQNWSASALFCLNSRAQSKYAVVNLIHTWRKQTFLSFIMW